MDRLPPECAAVRALRRRHGVAVEELAAASGFSVDVIYHFERGTRVPKREEIERLAAAMSHPTATVAPLLQALRGEEAETILPRPRSPLDLSAEEEAALDRETALLACEVAAQTREWATGEIRGQKLAEARRRAADLWKDLEALPIPVAAALLAAEPSLVDWALVELLCERSVEAAADKAARAAELAELAVQAAAVLQGEPAWCARAQGWAGFFLANARRVQGHLDKARRELTKAWELWLTGEGMNPFPFAEWRLFDLEASLLRDGGYFDESLARLEQASRFAPPAATGRILLKKAFTLEQKGEPEAALTTLAQAELCINPRDEPHYAWAVAFNRAVNLCHLERYTEARNFLPALDRQAQRLEQELAQLRLLWLSGRIAAGLGDPVAALAAFSRVRQELSDQRIDYDFAVVSLDIATLLLEQGELAAVRRLSGELAPILKRQKLHREAKAAVTFFCRAVAQEKATAELARRIAHFLRRAQQAPGLRFES